MFFGANFKITYLESCQVIAGGVATWYFTRDKASLHMTVK